MSTIKSSAEHLTLNADGSGNDIKFQSNGSEIASISDGGVITSTGGSTYADNVKAKFGTGNDLEIYSDGDASFIKENGSSELYIRGTNIIFKSGADNDDYIKCNENSDVKLYHSNSEKLATTSGGVSVTGDLYVSGAIGKDDGDKIIFSDNTHINFVVNGSDEMRLESDGDLHVDGDVIAYSTTISDERLKDNIEVVDGALDKVKELKGVTFTRKQDGQESAGVIAQDVEKVLPQAVKHKALPLHTGDDELFKTVQYDALHALLIEAVKELSEKVEKLENK